MARRIPDQQAAVDDAAIERRCLLAFTELCEYRVPRDNETPEERKIIETLGVVEDGIGRQPPSVPLAEARERALERLKEIGAVPAQKISQEALKAMQPALQQAHRAAQGSPVRRG